MCKKQYNSSTVTKFKARFNQSKSDLELFGEGRRGFSQENLINEAIILYIRTCWYKLLNIKISKELINKKSFELSRRIYIFLFNSNDF